MLSLAFFSLGYALAPELFKATFLVRIPTVIYRFLLVDSSDICRFLFSLQGHKDGALSFSFPIELQLDGRPGFMKVSFEFVLS